ncbi:DUF6514 family protein [Clostridium rectalis]|uniref:DUF6514 family protein n=1 Tax=Clostridium rectalis TaxID=2040295 RepID=UPI000F62C3B6|nr:DUF6514 family protein [Clostridium rectalis]
MVVVENLTRYVKEGEVEYIYSYRLLKGKISLNYGADSIDVQAYGIEIERQDKLNGNVFNIERDRVKSISPQRHKVHNLLRLMYDNSVSPIHLIEILGDYIDEYIIDFDNVVKDIAIANN